MRKIKGKVVLSAASFYLALSLSGCGTPTTPDTEGQSLADARAALREAGMEDRNIRVVGRGGDPQDLVVCDQDPDGVAVTRPTTLDVSTQCPADSEDVKAKKKVAKSSKKSSGKKGRG